MYGGFVGQVGKAILGILPILGILQILGILSVALSAQAGWASENASLSAATPHIEVVTGMYGVPGAKHVLDITERLQDLCGSGAQRCSVFCSDSSFGRYRLGHKPICRVTYRCGNEEVRSVEAWREEPILMRCPDRRDEQAPPAATVTN